MKIAVNTRFLLKDKLEGIGWFTYETLKRLVKNHPEHEFYFIFDRPYDESFVFAENVTPIVIWPPARHPLLWYIWFEKSIPKVLKKIKPDIFLSPDGYLSLKTKTPTLLVIHDLAFEHYPNDVGKLVKRYYRKFVPKFAKSARRIVTVSNFTKQDLHETYAVPLKKIDVIHNGVNKKYTPLSAKEKNSIKEKYTEGHDYFVYAGSIHPRKNIEHLFKAFDQFKNETGGTEKLVLVGRKGWSTKKIEETYEKMTHKNDVLFTGRVDNNTMHHLLGSALALTYISYFEGFGIPIIEAQQCGIPVITSKVTSMPEVAGEGALLVDPFSIKSIAEGMKRIKESVPLQKSLIEKGFENCHRFSWDNSANDLWLSILRTSN